MARTKGSEPRQHITPTRIQDGTGLEDKIAITIIDEFIAPLEVRVGILERQIADLLNTLGAVTAMATATVELTPGRHGGTTYIDGTFAEAQIGQAVLIVQHRNGDNDEFGIVQFTGEVLNRRKMRVRWHAEHGAPRRVAVVYLIGSEGAGT